MDSPFEIAAVRVTGANWTMETRVIRALVRRLGGYVDLTREELDPGDGGMIMSGANDLLSIKVDS
jgi:hypothetical protein